MNKMFIICDGSSKNNGTEEAVGAYAYKLVREGENDSVHLGVKTVDYTTNQRMELSAALFGLLEWEKGFADSTSGAIVISDSAYLINCVEQQWWVKWQKNGWKNAQRKPVANKDLWELLIPYFTRKDISFVKVTGHSDGATDFEKWNNEVDRLVQQAAATRKKELECV